MSKLLFAVHRYGKPGGSEYNVQWMAEGCAAKGHDVTVLCDEATPSWNGVKIESDLNLIWQSWDLIIVHGSCPVQDVVHINAQSIPSPIFYLLIQPQSHNVALHGMQHADFLGYGTSFDFQHILKHGYGLKARPIRYGIPQSSRFRDVPAFKERYGITGKMFVSAGGFWPHKRMNELAQLFESAKIADTKLVLFGYDNRHGMIPPTSENVITVFGSAHEEIIEAIYQADLYIQNSEAEGYGLVLLEAMLNRTPWVATDIAGAHDMAECGTVFTEPEELVSYMQYFQPNKAKLDYAYEHVTTQHMVANVVEDIERRVMEVVGDGEL